MQIHFTNPGVEVMLEHILDFQSENTSEFWSGPLFHFYPQLDRDHAASLPFAERKAYLSDTLRAVYPDIAPVIDQKVIRYAEYWATCRPQITAALSDAFECDCGALFNDIRCNVSMGPVEPRFLQKHAFDLFYLNSEKGAIGETIHELIHFVWFHVWHDLFGDSREEYESPSLKWILSEMAVEPVTSDERLSLINPYYPREQGGCIYPYFFTMETSEGNVMDWMHRTYRARNIRDFMRDSYDFCLRHEQEIRKHIAEAEQA